MVRVFLRIWHHICVLCLCSPSSSVSLIRLPWVGDWWGHLNLQQQLPISLLLHPSSARSFCMSRFVPSPDRHVVFFSCSSSVFGPWESHFPAPAVAFVFFFSHPCSFYCSLFLLLCFPWRYSVTCPCSCSSRWIFQSFLLAILQFR